MKIVSAILLIGGIGIFIAGRFVEQPLKYELYLTGFAVVIASFVFSAVYNKIKYGTFFVSRD